MFTKLPKIHKVGPLLCLILGLNLFLTRAAMGHETIVDLHLGRTNLIQNAPQTQAFILLVKNDITQLAQIKSLIEINNGQIIHTLPYQALITTVSPQVLSQLASLPGVAGVYTQMVDLAAVDIFGPKARHFASAWNSLIAPPAPPSSINLMTETHTKDSHDAFVAPDVPVGVQNASNNESVTPGYYQTSEYMAGSVAVGIVLVESNGSKDPSTENWTSDEKQLVFNEIMAALNWWTKLEPKAKLSFVYDDHFSVPLPTEVEPISRPFTDQQIWIKDAMSAMGYTGSSYFNRVRDYNNALRATYQTNWAFTIFVVDSSVDSDHRFSDSYFAYAYLGGPFMVLTYGNNGYGPSNMDAVAAHEIGHIFYALDQYSSAHQSCSNRSGYLNIENQNSQSSGCSSNVNSIMRGSIYPYTVSAIDAYSAGQIGWRDSDQDNIFDPLDVQLSLSLDEVIKSDQGISASGSANITPYPSPSHKSVTINRLTSVKYRLNYGSWQQAVADDGTFDETNEGYSFVSPSLEPGLYLLEVAAFDSAGNISGDFATDSILIPDPTDPGPNTEFYEPDKPITSHSTNINGLAYHAQGGSIAQVQYRINGGAWQLVQAQDGVFDSNYEPFSLSLSLSQSGTYIIETFAIDANGNAESNFARKLFQFATPASVNVFLPLVTNNR